MYFGLYQLVQSRRDAAGDAKHTEMDVSHHFTRQISEWLSGIFTKPFAPEDDTKH
jgi:hypothetical protein